MDINKRVEPKNRTDITYRDTHSHLNTSPVLLMLIEVGLRWIVVCGVPLFLISYIYQINIFQKQNEGLPKYKTLAKNNSRP